MYNPVARIRPYSSRHNKTGIAVKSHFTMLHGHANVNVCRDARVQIQGKNFNPRWGLFNGAIGTVKHIVFDENKNPNHGDLPNFIVVDFNHYTGPVWDPDNPTYVPIPCITLLCDKQCCARTFPPICLSFATTIHRCQGLTIGKNKEEQQQNSVQSMILDPGTKSFESNCPGTAYVGISRATSMNQNLIDDSSIFFCGKNINNNRFINMTKTPDGKKTHLTILRRNTWIMLLKTNTYEFSISEETKLQLYLWCNKTRISADDPRHPLNSYKSLS
jgi:hypothetical protein